MNPLLRTLRLTVGFGALTAAGLIPAIANAGEPEQLALQPARPTVKFNRSTNQPPQTAPKLDPTAPGAKIDAMDTPKVYLKPSNVGKVPPFRDSFLGAHPTLGAPDDGGLGYTHYGHPPYRYDIWYRPHAFGYGPAERCAPGPFRPRGFGDLFAEPSTCYRMDYSRYVMKNYGTDYGPSYYRRRASETCNTYDLSQHYRPECDRTRLRPSEECGPGGTKVWTLSRNHHE
jgi:hypothetical protein